MIMKEYFHSMKNGQTVFLKLLPVLDYNIFSTEVLNLLEQDENHCANYYAYDTGSDGLKFICIIANDAEHVMHITSHEIRQTSDFKLSALSKSNPSLHIFEREIAENFGIEFIDHPWPKPVRFPHDRSNSFVNVNDYPFYQIESDELHEVGVGPIHAGVIEPGHFRFICHGEMVLHLEIQLGWQHRGIENLFLKKTKLLQRNLLSESIAGDTAIGHSLAFTQLMESQSNVIVDPKLSIERIIALELERIAVHVGDISALCTDVAYQLGTNVFGALRTPIINFMQAWCGNRFGKGLIRVGGTHYPLNAELVDKLENMLEDFESRFNEMAQKAYTLPSVENRFQDVGAVTEFQAREFGFVGMSARMSNVNRDVRASHPFAGFEKHPYEPVILDSGDVFARFLLRRQEINKSIEWIRGALEIHSKDEIDLPIKEKLLNGTKNALTISLTEGWRGEICHSAITDASGKFRHYKIKDPSFHNWKALELSLRNLEISDFPINNKSYNLSYCGHDL